MLTREYCHDFIFDGLTADPPDYDELFLNQEKKKSE